MGFVDFRDPEIVRKAMKPNTKLIFSETPANPVLSLCDIEAISKIAKEHGAYHVVDATFATPVICRPLEHGADMVIQSLTKYYEGHNMMTGGAVISKTPELAEKLKWVQNVHGNIMNPFAAFIVLQTTKTMALRVKQQSHTALAIAKFLESHPKVTKVVYPGLESHPQKALADKYHRNNLHGGMLWFDIVGGSDAGTRLMNSIQRPLEPLREPGRHREHHHRLRRDDAREHAQGGPVEGRHHGRLHPCLLRHRGHGRPHPCFGGRLGAVLSAALSARAVGRCTISTPEVSVIL